MADEGLAHLAKGQKGTALRLDSDTPNLLSPADQVKAVAEVKAALEKWRSSPGMEKRILDQREQDIAKGYQPPPPSPEEIKNWKPEGDKYDRTTAYLVGVFQLFQNDPYIKRDEIVWFRTAGRLVDQYLVQSVSTSLSRNHLALEQRDSKDLKEWEKKAADAYETAIEKAIAAYNQGKAPEQQIAAKKADAAKEGGYDTDFFERVTALQKGLGLRYQHGKVGREFASYLEQNGFLSDAKALPGGDKVSVVTPARGGADSSPDVAQVRATPAVSRPGNEPWITIGTSTIPENPVIFSQKIASQRLPEATYRKMSLEQKAGFFVHAAVANVSDADIDGLFLLLGERIEERNKNSDLKMRANALRAMANSGPFEKWKLFENITDDEMKKVEETLCEVLQEVYYASQKHEKFSMRYLFSVAAAERFAPDTQFSKRSETTIAMSR